MIFIARQGTFSTMLNELDVFMMQRALKQARKAAQINEVPVGAVIHRDQQILSESHNLRQSRQDPTAHAEIIALQQAAKKIGSWRLQGCTLVVTLEPCPMCAGALVNARIDRLAYGAADPKMGCVDSLYRLCHDNRFNHRLEVCSGVLGDECSRMLSEFFQRLRRENDE